MLHKLLEKLKGIREREIRIALVRESVSTLSPQDFVEFVAHTIDRCLKGVAPGEDALLALIPCMLDLHGDPDGYEKIRDAYAEAMALRTCAEGDGLDHIARRYDVVRRLLLNPPPHQKPPIRTFKFGPRWERDVTLGEKKMLATQGNRLYIDRLVYEGDPQVIARLCANPRVLEGDILTIVTRRPNKPSTLDIVARSQWLNRYPVRHALALNPYNSTGVAMRILPLLHEKHLDSMQHSDDLHPLVSETASALVGWRVDARS